MTQPSDSDNALKTLKGLLLGEEQQQIEALSERLQDPDLRGEDVAEVLPEALRLSDARGPELTESLEPPVTRCIERSIRQDPENFANALYPVMGPAIRQSISNTLKGLVEHINRTLEHSLSIQGLRWRIESLRSGVPFAEIVLRHTLAYRVEQVFLIQPGSGLLMQHVQDELAVGGDADAISGMLTAITQFVKDAFQADEHEGLETVEIGEHTVLLVHGPEAYLAAVVRGVVPLELREQCQEVLENLHARYRSKLSEFNGDPDSLAPLAPRLAHCLQSRTRETEKRGGLSPALIVVLLLMLVLAGWLGLRAWQTHRDHQAWLARQHDLVERLERQAGIALTDVDYGDGMLSIRGLRDPLAQPLAPLLQAAGVDSGQVRMQWTPYLDLDPGLVLRRARRALAPPATVQLDLHDRELVASGRAGREWRERARLIAAALPGVDGFDDSLVEDPDALLLAEARKVLGPPPGVELRVRQGVLKASGVAPLDWIADARKRVGSISGLRGSSLDDLTSSERLESARLQRRIEQTFIFFTERSELDPEQQRRLGQLADDIQALRALSARIGRSFQVLLIGRTDGLGPPALNDRIALSRALLVRDRLVGLGLPQKLFRWGTDVGTVPALDPTQRRAEFRILWNRED